MSDKYDLTDVEPRICEFINKLNMYSSMKQISDDRIKEVEEKYDTEKRQTLNDQLEWFENARNIINSRKTIVISTEPSDLVDQCLNGAKVYIENQHYSYGTASDINDRLIQIDDELVNKLNNRPKEGGLIAFLVADDKYGFYTDFFKLTEEAFYLIDTAEHMLTLEFNESKASSIKNEQEVFQSFMDSRWWSELSDIIHNILPQSYISGAVKHLNDFDYSINNPSENGKKIIPIGDFIVPISQTKDWPGVYEKLDSYYHNYIQSGYLIVPFYWSINSNRNMALMQIKSGSYTLDTLEMMILASILMAPVGNYKLCCASANGLAAVHPVLSSFIKKFPDVTGGTIITDRNELRDALRDYMHLVNQLIQDKLLDYSSVSDFNMKNPAAKIPYRTLAISHFPLGFDIEMVDNLQKIILAATKCGINVLLHVDKTIINDVPDKQTEFDRKVIELLSRMPGYEECGDNKNWKYFAPPGTDTLFWMRPDLVPSIVNKDFVDKYAELYEKAINKSFSVDQIINENGIQKGYSGDELEIPFGVNENGKIQCLKMGDTVADGTSHYALIAGPTGSGKSVLLHTLIDNALLKYSPSELQLCLLDFKEGTEFKIYGDYDIPQIKYLALDSMQQFGVSILEKLMEIMNSRAEKFRKASHQGTEIKNISQFREAGYKMPRILVVIDEFQVLFNADLDRKTAYKAASLFGELIAKARAYGIHFILATQTLSKLSAGNYSISKSTLDEMHIRIGLHNTPKEAERLFGDLRAKDAMNKQEGKKGSGVYLENDNVSEPVAVKIAFFHPEEEKKQLHKISQRYKNEEHARTKVFRGSSPALVSVERLKENSEKAQSIWIGKPVKISANVSVPVKDKKKNNLLVLGEKQFVLNNIASLWIRQAGWINGNGDLVYVLDGNLIAGESALLNKSTCPGVHYIENAFRVLSAIDDVYEIYKKRKQNMIAGVNDPEDQKAIHLVISEYQLIDPVIRLMENKDVSEYTMDLNVDDANYDTSATDIDSLIDDINGLIGNNIKPKNASSDNVSPQKKFHTLIENGYMCGVHILLTCSDMELMKNPMKSDLSVFNHRIVLKSASDSVHFFIDSDVNMKYMPDNTVLYSNGNDSPYLIKPFQVMT